MFKGRIKPFVLSLTAVALMAASHVQAASFNIMAIGDSLTAGVGSDGSGWIEPLRLELNNAPGVVNSFAFVGSQQNDKAWRNEGYSGDYISDATEVAKKKRDDPTENEDYVATGASTAARLESGLINPNNYVTDPKIIMLLIGTNGNRADADGGADAVAELSLLINDLVANHMAATDKLLVSTLSPVAYQRKRFNSDLFSDDPENAGINEFNQNLLEVFESDGMWDSDDYASGTIAQHDTHGDKVFLLDLNSAFRGTTIDGVLYDEPPVDYFVTAGNDYLHFSDLGNELVANFYTDRYYELGLQQVPSPTSAATIILLMAGTGLTRRRRRQAA